MIAPPRARRPGSPAQFRTLLYVFAIRHVLSIGFLTYLTYLAWKTGGTFVYIMATLSLGFLGFAAYQGYKILGMYQRTRRRADAKAAEGGN